MKYIQSEVGVAKVANNKNDLVKGSLTRQKLQNSKVTLSHRSFRQRYNYFREEVCRYKFEVN